jgi:hypothetical protein
MSTSFVSRTAPGARRDILHTYNEEENPETEGKLNVGSNDSDRDSEFSDKEGRRGGPNQFV